MKGIINLTNPLKVNNKDLTALNYDTEEITGLLFAEADARKMKASGSKSGNLAGAAEIDYSLQLYLGYAAVIAVNSEIDWSDMERIKGHDVMEVLKIGRNFIVMSEAASPAGDSGEPSETTPDASTQASGTSKKNG